MIKLGVKSVSIVNEKAIRVGIDGYDPLITNITGVDYVSGNSGVDSRE